MRSRSLNFLAILLLMVLSCFSVISSSASAGTPHAAYGTVQTSTGEAPSDANLSFTAYISTRPGEVLSKTSAGCGYSGGAWWVQCGTFSTNWTAGEVLHIDFIDAGSGGTGSDEVTLTNNPQDDGGLTVLQTSGETISKPGTPSGETSPLKDVSYTYTTTGATSSLGHVLEYRFNWGDGSSSSWATSKSASHSWSTTGSKTVTVTARCKTHNDKTNISDGLVVTVQAEETISKPGTPAGETNPVKDINYSYITSGATSNLDHVVEYRFNWGDGSNSSWSTTKSASHSWATTGSKNVTVTARCQIHTDKTNTSDALTVNVTFLAPPANVAASDGDFNDKVRVTWDPSVGASYYRVFRNTSDDESGVTAISSWQSTTSYDDFSVTQGQLYYYWIKSATTNTGSMSSNFSTYDVGHSGAAAAEWFYFEAENCEIVSPMLAQSDVAAFNGQYVHAPNANGANDFTGFIRYRFWIHIPGDYILWCRVYGPDGDSNSFWVNLNGGTDWLWDTPKNATWGWNAVIDRGTTKPVTLHLTSDRAHELTIKNREDGARIDALYCINQQNATPPDSELQPWMKLLTPNGGEVLKGLARVNWIQANVVGPNYLKYSIDDGKTWVSITRFFTGNTLVWSLPNKAHESCLLRITFKNNPMVNDVSDGHFTIKPYVLYDDYMEAEFAALSTPMKINQDVNAFNSKYIMVPDGTGDNFGDSMFLFTVPQSGNYLIWGRIKGLSGNANSFFVKFDKGQEIVWQTDKSGEWIWDAISEQGNAGAGKEPEIDPALFYISADTVHSLIIRNREDGTQIDAVYLANFKPDDLPPEPEPYLHLKAPVPDDTLWAGTNIIVRWDRHSFTDPVRLEYTTDDGKKWVEIATNITGNSHNWQVPYFNSDSCLIRVTSVTAAHCTDLTRNYIYVREGNAPRILSQNLAQGWHLISFPLETTDPSVAGILSSLNASWQILSNFSNNAWFQADATISSTFWTLSQVSQTDGYWLYLNSNATFSLTGILKSQTIALIKGWNMIGFPSMTAKSVESVLTSLAGKWQKLYGYSNDIWRQADASLPTSFWTLTEFEPVRGYWLQMGSSANLQFDGLSQTFKSNPIVSKSNTNQIYVSQVDGELSPPELPFGVYGFVNIDAKPIPIGSQMTFRWEGNDNENLTEVRDNGEYGLVTLSLPSSLEKQKGPRNLITTIKIADELYTSRESVEYENGANQRLDISFNPQTSVISSQSLCYQLLQNFPNPFNNSTSIYYSVANVILIEITIYNISGEKVITLIREKKSPGTYLLTWDGRDDKNSIVTSGVYLCKMKAGEFEKIKKLIFVK